MVSITHFTLLAAMLFSLGLIGVLLNRKNIITLLMSIELMLLAVNINFVAFSHQWQNLTGQVFVLFVLTVAAAEVAIGLAIVVVFYRLRAHIRIDSVNDLKN
ncbi:MAG: NADH-quinone oxidoreductase subunit NuoK [Alphaproteobacteria bacterium]|nr:NADH-quinone oxidoreductase subunit NuoK [Alphaproteobacteria bacterium]